MCADVVNPAAFEDENRVGVDQRGQAVRDDDQGAALRNAQQVGVDDRLAVGVERAGRLVEDQDPRVADQRPRNREPLLLTARQVRRAFLDEGLVAARQLLDEFLGAGQTRRLDDLLEAGIGLRGGDRLADRPAEQEILLQHDAQARAQVVDVDLAQIVAVDLDQPLIIAVQQLQQPGDSGLARPASPDDAEHGAFGNGERHLLERRRVRALVAKGDLVELDAADQRGADPPARAPLFGRLIDHARDQLHGAAGFIELNDGLRGLDQRTDDAVGQHHKGDDRADIHRILVRKREIHRHRDDAVCHQPLERVNDGLHPVRQDSFGVALFRDIGDMHVPLVAVLGVERQGFNGANTVDRLDQEGSAAGLGRDHGADTPSDRRQHKD